MSTTMLVTGRSTRILLMNPNSSSAMTDAMKKVIDDIDLPASTEVHTYTAPSDAPASIDNNDDMTASTKAVLRDFYNNGPHKIDGIVVACFSLHSLVGELPREWPNTAITGILEASVAAAIPLLGAGQKWGIVTTGAYWEEHLAIAVRSVLGAGPRDANVKFAGVRSTGLNASDFHHGIDPAVIREKLKAATKSLLDVGNVAVIVMGCAGMVGLEDIIRETACEKRGEEFAYSTLHVIDGVRAGIMQVDQMIKNRRLRPGWKW
ncbi:hydantoin racemase [Hypoxylon argillaceum]|nr:hydantoin racemase [Hypoxylon argillaceum]